VSTKRLALIAMLVAQATILHYLEGLLPNPVPIPGVKLGLANIITLLLLDIDNSFIGHAYGNVTEFAQPTGMNTDLFRTVRFFKSYPVFFHSYDIVIIPGNRYSSWFFNFTQVDAFNKLIIMDNNGL
jgi:riboflavin transporter FmnP